MGQRLLEINTNLVLSLLQGMKSGPSHYFRVTDDPIPDDVKILSIKSSVYHTDTIEVELASKDWPEADELRQRVKPTFEIVTSPNFVI